MLISEEERWKKIFYLTTHLIMDFRHMVKDKDNERGSLLPSYHGLLLLTGTGMGNFQHSSIRELLRHVCYGHNL